MLFILLWLISPIILLVLYLVQLSANAELKRSNKALNEKLQALLSQNSQASDAAVEPQTEEALPPEQPVDVRQTELSYKLPPQVQTPPSAAPTEYAEKAAYAPAPKKKISTINIILILGALFLSLSGFIFAAAAWGVLNSFFKAVVLVSFSALFFGIHSFTERKLKLEQTGRIFYILGSVFLPAAVVAAGLLEVFGEYLSFYGDGRLLVFAAVTLSVCIPFFKGAHDYKNKFFAAVSHYSFSATVVFLLFHIIPRADVAVLVSAVYSLITVIAEPLVKRIYDRLFGEENIFSEQYSYCTIISTTVLGILSICVFLDDTLNLVTLFAFAIYSVCFLTKTVTEKHNSFSAVAFAVFITISLFSGFDPDTLSGFTCITASTALIYAVLSAMGILPDAVRKAFKILAITVSAIAGLMGIIENTLYLIDESVPTLEIVLASGVVFAEMLILALRYKSNEFKTFTFAALIWFVTDLVLIFELGLCGILICFAAVTAYFLAARITPLKSKLESGANDIVFAIYTLINSICCCVENDIGCFAAIGVLLLGTAITAALKNGKYSAVLCPILTFQTALPTLLIFMDNNIVFPYAVENGDSAMSVIIILFCILASLFLFIPKATAYAKSYGISLLCLFPVFIISCIIWESADFVSMLAICVYTALFLAKHSFPKEKFTHINLLNSAILITSFIAGIKLLDNSDYLFCFPAVAVMLIFAVYALGEAFDVFQNVNPHICGFLWWTAPLLGCCLFISGCDAGDTALIIFGAILALCTSFASVIKKNTFNMLLPIIAFTVAIDESFDSVMLVIPLVLFLASGRILFNERMFNKRYFDIFSIGAYLPVVVFLCETSSDLESWIAVLLLALLTLNLMRKGHGSTANRRCVTAAGLFIFPLFWIQPFFDVPELINIQFNLLPVFFFCLLVKLIWKDAASKADSFSFAAAIISLVILFVESLTSSDSFDAVFIGIVLFIMLAVSFIIKKKRWFVLAVASMAASGVLLSFGQRDSIAWLVYLALAGAALITLGLANELKKQQQKNGEETKLSRFMSDWTW